MEQGLLDFFTSQRDKTAKQREMMQRQMEAEQLMQQADLGHVRVLDADAAQALGGSEAGREIRWVLIGSLIAVLIFEQLLALRLSYHPDVPVRS